MLGRRFILTALYHKRRRLFLGTVTRLLRLAQDGLFWNANHTVDFSAAGAAKQPQKVTFPDAVPIRIRAFLPCVYFQRSCKALDLFRYGRLFPSTK